MAGWTCNSCGSQGKTSREHLLHVAIGRVILANRSLKPEEVRKHLQNDYFGQFTMYEDPFSDDPKTRPTWLNQAIKGMICEACNNGWARQLEEEAGTNLYDFSNLHGHADAAVLVRWAWFFAVKMWFMNSRPDALKEGPLRPLLGKLALPDFASTMPVMLTRVDASPRTWNFAGTAMGWRGDASPFLAWIMRGMVWMVVADESPKVTLPLPATQLVDGIRRQDVVEVRRKRLVNLFRAPPSKFGR